MTGTGGVDPRFARSARRWLVAYPPAWRAERGEEVTSLLADLAASDARRVGLRAGLPLLWSGLATRRRQSPPLRVVLEYRLFNHPVPARHRAWVRADLERPWRPVRELPWRLLGLAPLLWFLGIGAVASATHALALAAYLCTIAGVDCALDARRRRTVAERHLLPGPGEPEDAGLARRALVARDRGPARTAVSRLLRGVAVLGAGAAGTLVVVATRGDADPATAVAAAAGAGAGLTAAAVARRRRRLLDDPPPQPGRRTVAPDPAGALAAPLLALALVLVSLAALVGGDRRGVLATVLLTVALVLAPPVLATRRWLEGRPGLVAVDVVRALLRGRPPAVDLPVRGFVPVEPVGPAGVPAGSGPTG